MAGKFSHVLMATNNLEPGGEVEADAALSLFRPFVGQGASLGSTSSPHIPPLPLSLPSPMLGVVAPPSHPLPSVPEPPPPTSSSKRGRPSSSQPSLASSSSHSAQKQRPSLLPFHSKRTWTSEEDALLLSLVAHHGSLNWTVIGLAFNSSTTGGRPRKGKQCRERYVNHLRPEVVKGGWTKEEDDRLLEHQRLVGNKWAEIASKACPGRTDNDVKNRFHSISRFGDGGEPLQKAAKKDKSTASAGPAKPSSSSFSSSSSSSSVSSSSSSSYPPIPSLPLSTSYFRSNLALRCPQGHALLCFVIPSTSNESGASAPTGAKAVVCKDCGVSGDEEAGTFLGCDECAFDLCWECAGDEENGEEDSSKKRGKL